MGVSEGYSPLEQYAGIKEFNPATDIYALAATMLYTLNGVTPKGASDLKLSEVRTNLAKLAPQQAIDALCKALNKSHDDRTSSVNAFKADLGVVGTGGQDTDPINPDDDKRKKYLITGIFIVAIIAVVVCCVYLMSKHKPEPQPVPTPVETYDSISTYEAEAAAIPAKEESQENTESGQPVQNNQNEQSGNNNQTQLSTPSQTQHQTSHQTQQQVEPIEPVATTGTISLGYATWRGGIKNGKPDGKGRMTFLSTHKVDRRTSVEAHSGDYFDATYENGSLISGKLYDSDGNLLKTIIP